MTTKAKGKILFTVRLPVNIKKVLAEIAALAILVSILYVAVTYERPYDGTDWPDMRLRSGLTLYIDYGTGCHWVKVGVFGNLFPRLNSNKEHVCVEADYRGSAKKT